MAAQILDSTRLGKDDMHDIGHHKIVGDRHRGTFQEALRALRTSSSESPPARSEVLQTNTELDYDSDTHSLNPVGESR